MATTDLAPDHVAVPSELEARGLRRAPRTTTIVGLLLVAGFAASPSFCRARQDPAPRGEDHDGEVAGVPAPPPLSDHLAPFEPFLNAAWRGQVAVTDEGQPLYDVACWETGLHGQAVRMWHALSNGSYGGETLFVWDREAYELAYFYFTTAGFFSRGTVEFLDEGTFVSREEISGNESGFTRVEATSQLSGDGRLVVRTRMLRDGEWVDRGEVRYERRSATEACRP